MPKYELHRDATGPEPRYRVSGIELFHPHKYPGSEKTGEKAREYTEADVDAMVAEGLKAKDGVKTFIGHNYPGSDQPERKVRGKFRNFRKETREGLPTVVADLEDADPLMALNLVRGHYPHRSPEFSPSTLSTRGIAWLGSREPYFKFPEVKPVADRALVDQIKADAKDFALREDVESDLTALRADLMSMGGMGNSAGGIDNTALSQQVERLTGVISEQQKQINALLAEQQAIKDIADIFKGGKKPSDSKTGDTAMADEKKTETVGAREDAAVVALREEFAKAQVKIAALENERVKDAIRADITALRSKVVIADDTADAIIGACAPIADAAERKKKFDALTKGLRTAPLEDAAPEANTAIREQTATGIADEKVRALYKAAKPEKAKQIKQAWDDLCAIREKTDERMWETHYLNDAEGFVKAQIA